MDTNRSWNMDPSENTATASVPRGVSAETESLLYKQAVAPKPVAGVTSEVPRLMPALPRPGFGI